MTRHEQHRFIDQELKGLWPQWSPTDAEVRVWTALLSEYDYDAARSALLQCFCEQAGNYTRPRPAPFLARLRSLRVATPQARRPPQADIQTRVFLECIEAPPWNVHLAQRRVGVYVLPAARLDDVEYVRRCAESMRRRFIPLYGGAWITVVGKARPARPSIPPCARAESRRQACAQILAGPETPGRRWLERYLARAARRDAATDAAQTSEPARLAEQIDRAWQPTGAP